MWAFSGEFPQIVVQTKDILGAIHRWVELP